MMNKAKTICHISLLLLITACKEICYPYEKMQVVCVPVYGQSYALGEEATRVTDFDSLRTQYNHRILTENLDEAFGYFSDTEFKQYIKKVINDDKRSFELQCYGMAEHFLSLSDNDSILFCTFPGGQGSTSIVDMMPGSKPYVKFINEIKSAYSKAKNKGWDFCVPAYCWMQGEDDIVWHKSPNYKKNILEFHNQLSKDIMDITHQKQRPICICYQSNCLSMLNTETSVNTYNRPETYVPNDQLNLITQRKDFMASGPVYPYNCVNENIHIDGIGQKTIGYLSGLTLHRYFNGENSDGLYPKYIESHDNEVVITFNVPYPPLTFDTIQVSNPGHYGFSVITTDNRNIIKDVKIQNDKVRMLCSESIQPNYKVRYGVNGIPHKNGNRKGARGNLRDSQGETYKCNINNNIYRLDNWCFIFDWETGDSIR